MNVCLKFADVLRGLFVLCECYSKVKTCCHCCHKHEKVMNPGEIKVSERKSSNQQKDIEDYFDSQLQKIKTKETSKVNKTDLNAKILAKD